MIRLCAWCKEHTHYANSVDESWKPITLLVLQFAKEEPDKISHGICPRHFDKVSREIEFENRREEAGNTDDRYLRDILHRGGTDGDE